MLLYWASRSLMEACLNPIAFRVEIGMFAASGLTGAAMVSHVIF